MDRPVIALWVALVVGVISGAVYAFDAVEKEHLFQRHESQAAASKMISLRGRLICTMAESNDGAACSMRLREKTSGQIYMLSNVSKTQALFARGQRDVLIQGRLIQPQQIEVSKAEAI